MSQPTANITDGAKARKIVRGYNGRDGDLRLGFHSRVEDFCFPGMLLEVPENVGHCRFATAHHVLKTSPALPEQRQANEPHVSPPLLREIASQGEGKSIVRISVVSAFGDPARSKQAAHTA